MAAALSRVPKPIEDVTFTFLPGVHLLTQTHALEQVRNMAITGTTADPADTVLACPPGATHRAFSFEQVRGFTASNMTLANCTGQSAR